MSPFWWSWHIKSHCFPPLQPHEWEREVREVGKIHFSWMLIMQLRVTMRLVVFPPRKSSVNIIKDNAPGGDFWRDWFVWAWNLILLRSTFTVFFSPNFAFSSVKRLLLNDTVRLFQALRLPHLIHGSSRWINKKKVLFSVTHYYFWPHDWAGTKVVAGRGSGPCLQWHKKWQSELIHSYDVEQWFPAFFFFM